MRMPPSSTLEGRISRAVLSTPLGKRGLMGQNLWSNLDTRLPSGIVRNRVAPPPPVATHSTRHRQRGQAAVRSQFRKLDSTVGKLQGRGA